MIAPIGPFVPASPDAAGRLPLALVLTGVLVPATVVLPIGWNALPMLRRPRPKTDPEARCWGRQKGSTTDAFFRK